jgi:hypothetical protein
MSYFAIHHLRLGHAEVLPGRKIKDGLLSDQEIARLLKKGAIQEFTSPKPAAATPSANQEASDPALWAYPAEALAGKPLETLNMMIQEHVKKFGLAAVEPMETLEEAMHWLGKDLKK